jgi:hypothetical protein
MEGTAAAAVGDGTDEELILKQPKKITGWMGRRSDSIPYKTNLYLGFAVRLKTVGVSLYSPRTLCLQ